MSLFLCALLLNVVGLLCIVLLLVCASLFTHVYYFTVCVFENRVFRRIFGPKREQVTGERRKLHKEELNILYSSPNIVRVTKSRRMGWAGHAAGMGEERGVYRVLVGKPEGKRPLGRPRLRWEDNIKVDLQEVGCGGYGLD